MILLCLPALAHDARTPAGLKEALQIGVRNAVSPTGRRAVVKAGKIFGDAIGTMTFDDARQILTGGDTAATESFRSKTSTKLKDSIWTAYVPDKTVTQDDSRQLPQSLRSYIV